MTMTKLTPEQFRSGEPCPVHDLPWCAPCAGRDRKSVRPDVEGTVAVEVEASSVTYAIYAGRCPSCLEAFAPRSKIGYSEELEGWVPLHCCAQPSETDPKADYLRSAYRTSLWTGRPYPRHDDVGAMPETTMDDHLEDPAP